jgi:hypothetical protein
MLTGCVAGAVAVIFTGGCVRELTRLEFEALPGDAGVRIAGDTIGDALVDAALDDAAHSSKTDIDAATTQHVGYDAFVDVDASAGLPEAGIVTSVPFVDAAKERSDEAVVTLDMHADAGAGSGVVGSEQRVFELAAPLEMGDAGLPVVPIFPASNLVIDGSNADWSHDGWLRVSTPDTSIGEPLSTQDLSAALAVRWDSEMFYLVVTVLDDHHANDASGFDIWDGDSIQVAFDVGHGRLPYDWEYGFAKTSHGLTAHRWHEGDADVTTDIEFSIVRRGAVTVYEVAFKARHLGASVFPMNALRMSVAVNDNDDEKRSAALELVQGIVGTKSATQFARVDWKR